MRSRTRNLLAHSLLLLVGCRAVGTVLMIPVAVTAVVFGSLAGIFVSAESASEEAELHAGGLRVDERVLEVELASDLTFAGHLVVVTTVTSPVGLEAAQLASLSYDPRFQGLELVAARVENPDGVVHEVSPDQVFERPSAADRGTPEFVTSTTKSVLFPHLTVGSRTFVEWRFEQRATSELGFTYAWRPPFALPVGVSRIRITYDPDVPLRFAADPPFEVHEGTDGGRRMLEAVLRDWEGLTPERAMVAPRDVCPELVVTTCGSWEELGAAYHEAVSGRVEVTPRIEALAAEIVGDREGLDAARAIHRWVCRNIHYVVVYMNPMDGWIPHTASEVLDDRYGDCKDKYVLLASLLAARGIAAEPALVRSDRGFEPFALPTPLQFDHCMAYLPEFDLYSNPTDRFRDLGELQAPLSGKFVVIAGPEPRLARTPRGSAEGNRYRATLHAAVGTDGIFRGHSTMEFEGRVAGEFRRVLARTATPESAASGLLQAEPLGGIGALATTDPTDLDTPLRCEGDWTSEVPVAMGETIHFVTPAGIDFVNPLLIRRFLSTEERRFPALIMATDVRWRIEVELPEGYSFDALPPDRMTENAAGRFESRYRVDPGGTLVVERHLRVDQDLFPPEEYPHLRVLLLEAVTDIETILSASLAS